jgi:hypothetical protein
MLWIPQAFPIFVVSMAEAIRRGVRANALDEYFRLSERGTCFATEVRAGVAMGVFSNTPIAMATGLASTPPSPCTPPSSSCEAGRRRSRA